MQSDFIISDEKKIPENAEDYIREKIITGELSPGERIDERIFAETLGIGVTSVRSALSALCYDEYITFARGTGYRVGTLTKDDVKNLYYLSYILLRASIRSIKYNSAMMALLTESLVKTKDMTDYDSERKFHVTMALASRNQEFINASKSVYDKIQWWTCCSNTAIPFDEDILNEHKYITDEFINSGGNTHHIFELIEQHYQHHIAKLG